MVRQIVINTVIYSVGFFVGRWTVQRAIRESLGQLKKAWEDFKEEDRKMKEKFEEIAGSSEGR